MKAPGRRRPTREPGCSKAREGRPGSSYLPAVHHVREAGMVSQIFRELLAMAGGSFVNTLLGCKNGHGVRSFFLRSAAFPHSPRRAHPLEHPPPRHGAELPSVEGCPDSF